MASKTIFYLLSILLLHHFILSSGQNVKAAYWFRASEYPIDLINATLFTHLFCAFADLDSTTNQLVISQANNDSFSRFTTTVQESNPSVKTLLSIGGGSADRNAYASMVSQFSRRATFISSSINLARTYNFHGLDLDWEYPQTGFQMVKLGNLLSEWRTAINTEAQNTGRSPLLLTAAFYYSPTVNGVTYPIRSIARSLDWINVMAYDFYAPTWSDVTNAPAQLNDPSGHISGSDGIAAWILAGVTAGRLVLGMPFYGYRWRLVDPNNHGLFAPTTGPFGAGDGSVGYNEIREYGGTKVYNATLVTNYLYRDTLWVGYDDIETVKAKVSFAKSRGLRGYFAWHVGVDFGWDLSTTGFFSLLPKRFIYISLFWS